MIAERVSDRFFTRSADIEFDSLLPIQNPSPATPRSSIWGLQITLKNIKQRCLQKYQNKLPAGSQKWNQKSIKLRPWIPQVPIGTPKGSQEHPRTLPGITISLKSTQHRTQCDKTPDKHKCYVSGDNYKNTCYLPVATSRNGAGGRGGTLNTHYIIYVEGLHPLPLAPRSPCSHRAVQAWGITAKHLLWISLDGLAREGASQHMLDMVRTHAICGPLQN